MLRCEAGDLSGKHGQYSVGKGQQYYSDVDLPLFGLNSSKSLNLSTPKSDQCHISPAAHQKYYVTQHRELGFS